MNDGTSSDAARTVGAEAEWDRSERRSTRIALAIALIPIPIALAVSWAFGSPPWRTPPAQTFDQAPIHTGPEHGHR